MSAAGNKAFSILRGNGSASDKAAFAGAVYGSMAGREITADETVGNGEVVTTNSLGGPIFVTVSPGATVGIRMPEALISGLVTVRDQSGTIILTSDDWAGYAVTLRPAGSVWTYSAKYIYGGAA